MKKSWRYFFNEKYFELEKVSFKADLTEFHYFLHVGQETQTRRRGILKERIFTNGEPSIFLLLIFLLHKL